VVEGDSAYKTWKLESGENMKKKGEATKGKKVWGGGGGGGVSHKSRKLRKEPFEK